MINYLEVIKAIKEWRRERERVNKTFGDDLIMDFFKWAEKKFNDRKKR